MFLRWVKFEKQILRCAQDDKSNSARDDKLNRKAKKPAGESRLCTVSIFPQIFENVESARGSE